jgi:hypothetical protein
VNHIDTSRALSPGENYSLLIIGDSKVDEDGGEVDGDGGDGDGDRLMRVNSTNVLDEGLRIGGRGRRMNSKVRLVEISAYRK